MERSREQGANNLQPLEQADLRDLLPTAASAGAAVAWTAVAPAFKGRGAGRGVLRWEGEKVVGTPGSAEESGVIFSWEMGQKGARGRPEEERAAWGASGAPLRCRALRHLEPHTGASRKQDPLRCPFGTHVVYCLNTFLLMSERTREGERNINERVLDRLPDRCWSAHFIGSGHSR